MDFRAKAAGGGAIDQPLAPMSRPKRRIDPVPHGLTITVPCIVAVCKSQ